MGAVCHLDYTPFNQLIHAADNKHTTLVNLPGMRPQISSESFVAPSATLVGNVEVWDRASVWYDCVINGTPLSIRAPRLVARPIHLTLGIDAQPTRSSSASARAPTFRYPAAFSLFKSMLSKQISSGQKDECWCPSDLVYRCPVM